MSLACLMARVTILPVETSTELAEGDSLLDAGPGAAVEMAAGCFNGLCGTCVVEVVTGNAGLMPPSPSEIAVLTLAGHDPSRYRLACSARMSAGGVDVVIRQLD